MGKWYGGASDDAGADSDSVTTDTETVTLAKDHEHKGVVHLAGSQIEVSKDDADLMRYFGAVDGVHD